MAALEVVSTDRVAPKERLPYWKDLIWQLLGRLRSEARADGTFRGRMEYGDAGDVKMCRLSASSHRVSRTPDLIRQDDRGYLKVVFQLEGSTWFEQGGRKTLLSPGEWSIYDTMKAYTVSNTSDIEQMVLLVPREKILAAHLNPDELLVQRYDAQSGIGRLAGELMHKAFEEIESCSADSAETVGDAVAQLLRQSFMERAGRPTSLTLRDRIKTYIQRNLRDADLSIDRIAAYSWGFSSSTRFSKAFREAFGTSPKHYRMTAGNEALPEESASASLAGADLLARGAARRRFFELGQRFPRGVPTMRIFAFALTLLAASFNGYAQDRTFDFGLIGDMPYTKVQEVEYQRVLAALNAADLAFVAHIGDFQFDATPYNRNPATAAMPCVDENYKSIYDSFQSIRHAFILTPGDNDWSDCAPLAARKVDPLDLLAGIRTRFYPEGRSLGQRPIAVLNQSADPNFGKYRENLRWTLGGVMFATLHIVGENDNFGRSPEMDAEHAERKAANLAWLRQSFAEAKSANSRGLVILTQANPGFETVWPDSTRARYFLRFIPRGQPLPSRPLAFDDYLRALSDELETYDKPVAYLHGDTHIFRIDKPLFSRKTNRAFENFTRVETFGWPDSHWVRVTVDPADPQLFRFRAEVVPGNVVNRKRQNP